MGEYWFKEDGQAVASKLAQAHNQWCVWGNNPIAQAWLRNTVMYYSPVIDTTSWDTSLIFTGQQGELVKMAVPQARSLLRQLVTLLCRQRLAFRTIATVQGKDMSAQVKLGNGLSEHVVTTQKLEEKREILCEQALLYGMSFLKTTWRTDRGEFYTIDPEDGEAILTEGEIEISNHSIFDVFFDYSIENFADLDWIEVNTLKNKWTLIAQLPHLRQEIENLPPGRNYGGFYAQSYNTISRDDMVNVFEVYHRKTPALPEGRMIVYAGDDVVLYDGPNPYGKLPVFCMKPEAIHGLAMGFGYPFFSNLLPCQEMLDHGFSAIATNQGQFAVQNVAVPRGANIGVQEINGMNYISYDPVNAQGGGKPEALNLTQSAPESFKFIDLLLAHMQQISNLNSAVRGSPPPGVTSGAAIATLTTNALEFITSSARSLSECINETLSMSVRIYNKFAQTERVINVSGMKGQSSTPKKFVGNDLDSIVGVKLIEVNPIMQSLSGRMDLAEKLISQGMVSNVREYLSILDGEPIDSMIDVEQSENDLIKKENESMIDGDPVIVLATDDHPMHIREHSMLLNDPQRRKNAPAVGMVLEHIMEHYGMLKGPNAIDPMLMAIIRTGKIPEGGLEQPPPAPMPEEPNPAAGPGMPAVEPAAPAQDMLGRMQ